MSDHGETVSDMRSAKSWSTLLLLSAFGGWLGADRWYAGSVLLGVIKSLTFGGGGIWWAIDAWLAALELMRDGDGAAICSEAKDRTETPAPSLRRKYVIRAMVLALPGLFMFLGGLAGSRGDGGVVFMSLLWASAFLVPAMSLVMAANSLHQRSAEGPGRQ